MASIAQPTSAEPLRFSFVRGGPFYRIQRALGLVPEGSLGSARRIVALVAVTWLPIVVLALVDGRLFEGSTSEPLLRHFGIHARFLIALPAFVVGEGVLEMAALVLLPQFETSGLVDATTRAAFRDTLRAVERMRDSWIGAAVVLVAVAANAVVSWEAALHLDETTWALHGGGEGAGLSVAGWWYLGVSRPIFALILLTWLARLVLVAALCRRIARLDLRLVPVHPDKAAGLGFLELLPIAFTPVAFGASAVLASRWAHDIVYHGVHVSDLRMPLGAFVAVAMLLFLAPLAPFSGTLRRLKRRSLLQYGSLFSHYGRLVHRRWILGETLDDRALLDAPELGPVADVIAAYEAVDAIRPAPLRRAPLMALAGALVLPLLAMAAIEIPVKQLLMTIGSTLL